MGSSQIIYALFKDTPSHPNTISKACKLVTYNVHPTIDQERLSHATITSDFLKMAMASLH